MKKLQAKQNKESKQPAGPKLKGKLIVGFIYFSKNIEN